MNRNGHIENGYGTVPTNNDGINLKSVIEWGFKIVSMIILPLIIWMITLLISLDKRVSIMEGNILTATDGIQLREDVQTTGRDVLNMERRISSLEECQIVLRFDDGTRC